MRRKTLIRDYARRAATALLLAMMTAATAGAQDLTGSCGDNLTWTLTENGGTMTYLNHDLPAYDLTITGSGALTSTPYLSQTDVAARQITSITIDQGVTSLCQNAFRACENVRSIILPDGLTSIGNSAFFGCKALRTMVIPDGVTTISSSLFMGCDSLRTVTFGPDVERIDYSVFSNCPRLTVLRMKRYEPTGENEWDRITMPGSLSRFSDNCFTICAIVVPDAGYEDYKQWAYGNLLHDRIFWQEYGAYGDYGHVVRPDHEVLFKAGTTNLWTSWCDHIAHAAPAGAEVYTVERVEGTTVYLNRITATVDDPDGGGLRALIPAYTPVLIRRAAGTLDADLKMTYVSGGELTPENGWKEYGFEIRTDYIWPNTYYEFSVSSIHSHFTVKQDIMAEPPYGNYWDVDYHQEPLQQSPAGASDYLSYSYGEGSMYGNVGLCSCNYAKYKASPFKERNFILEGDMFRLSDQVDFGTYVNPNDPGNPIKLEPVVLPHRCRLQLNTAPGASELTLCTDGETVVTLSKEGYGTYYNSSLDVRLKPGMKARIVTANEGEGTLTYQTIADGDTEQNVVPAGTAVLLQTAETTDATRHELTLATAQAPAIAGNLLHGSNRGATTDGGSVYYKLSYGAAGSAYENLIGWYWGADDGAPFASGAHKVWLALDGSKPVRGFAGLPGFAESGTRLIPIPAPGREEGGHWYDLGGRKLGGRPETQGIYIRNGRKEAVK